MKHSLIVTTAVLFSIATASGGCSRSLPFSFQFASSAPDLSSAPVDMAALVGDQASSTLDQSIALDQSTTFDQSSSIDQSVGDLTTATPDLTSKPQDQAMPDLVIVPDMSRVRRPIGGACSTAADCVEGLDCLLNLNDKALEFPGGYCSKLCELNTQNPCGTGASCVPFYTPEGSQTAVNYCARNCLILTDCRDNKYSCCAPVSSALTSVCGPEGLQYCQ